MPNDLHPLNLPFQTLYLPANSPSNMQATGPLITPECLPIPLTFVSDIHPAPAEDHLVCKRVLAYGKGDLICNRKPKRKVNKNLLLLCQQLHPIQQRPRNLAIQILSRWRAMRRSFLRNGRSGIGVLRGSSRGNIVAIRTRRGTGSCRHWTCCVVRCARSNCRRLKYY
jgi:hypothetical protein